ncbi:hypothetical protein ES708_17674 [subsurface metagenome]
MSFYNNSDEKGDRAERKVSKVLEKLEREGVIESFGWTTPFSGDNLFGIDFLIYPIKGKEIPLQVKSSYRKELEEKYTQKGIFCIIVKPYQRLEEIRENVLEILEKAEKRRKQ